MAYANVNQLGAAIKSYKLWQTIWQRESKSAAREVCVSSVDILDIQIEVVE
jgi:hypothetical protein